MKAGVMKLQAISAILLCFFSVLGLYALFARVATALAPRGRAFLSLDGRTLSSEEILLWLSHARLIIEREHGVEEHPAVLLYEDDEEKIGTLRKEGVLVFTLKKEEI